MKASRLESLPTLLRKTLDLGQEAKRERSFRTYGPLSATSARREKKPKIEQVEIYWELSSGDNYRLRIKNEMRLQKSKQIQ